MLRIEKRKKKGAHGKRFFSDFFLHCSRESNFRGRNCLKLGGVRRGVKKEVSELPKRRT